MQKGVIQESSSHADLLSHDGIYTGLYNQQFKVALEAIEIERAVI